MNEAVPSALDCSTNVVKTPQEQAKQYAELAFMRMSNNDIGNAESLLKAALDIDPMCFEAAFTLGALSGMSKYWLPALVSARAAAALRPDDPRVYLNLGLYLNQIQHFSEASSMFEKARQLIAGKDGSEASDTNWLVYQHNIGLLRYNQNRSDDAIRHLTEAVKLYKKCGKPAAAVKSDLSLAILKSGKLHEGLIANEIRWDGVIAKSAMWDCKLPLWDGQNLEGKTLLLHHEQGYGDTIQFMRYIPQLKADTKVAGVMLAVPTPFMRLVKGQCGVDEVVDMLHVGPIVSASLTADYHCPLLSMVRQIGVEFPSMTRKAAPYLRVAASPSDSIGATRRSPKLPAGSACKVGIVWAARPGLGAARSVPLEEMVRLAEVPGVKLYSLQFGEAREDIETFHLSPLVEDLVSNADDFADLAQQMTAMDLIVSVDTAAAHLAGALGRPTWLLQPVTQCWRWACRAKPWYGSMTEYFQMSDLKWSNPIGFMKADLRRVVNEG